MTSYLNSHRTTGIKPEMLSGVPTGNGTPRDKYDITRNCLCAHKQKRRHFHAKTTSAKLYVYIGVGSRDLFIDEAHTTLGIFPVISLYNAYSALRHFIEYFPSKLCPFEYFSVKYSEILYLDCDAREKRICLSLSGLSHPLGEEKRKNKTWSFCQTPVSVKPLR